VSLSQIRRIRNPERRAAEANEYLRAQEAASKRDLARIREVRDKAAREMLAMKDEDGAWVYRPADVARTLKMTRPSVSQRFGKRG